MKRIITICMSFLALTYGMNAQNIVAEYPLDETSGTVAVDASGNSLDVPLVGISDENWIDGSLYLNGTQYGQLLAPDSDPFKMSSITVSAWITHDTEMNNWGDWICAHGDNWGFYLHGAAGDIESEEPGGLLFYIFNGTTWLGVLDGNRDAYLDGEWHYVAATFDHTTFDAKIYHNGELVNEGSLEASINYTQGTDAFYIGSMGGITGPERFWKGNIKGLKIWDAVNEDAVDIPITAIEESTASGMNLSNYPNPFTAVTTINYTIRKASDVNITVFDVAGKEVEVLVNENKQAGSYSVNWDGSNLPAGIYLYKIQNESYTAVNRMVKNK